MRRVKVMMMKDEINRTREGCLGHTQDRILDGFL